MLDLIPTQDIPLIMAEFHRVLHPGGQLVLLNMSKQDESIMTFQERLYRHLPASVVLYLMGGCRPVLMEAPVRAAGLEEVARLSLAEKHRPRLSRRENP